MLRYKVISSQDNNAEENIDWKINLYLQLEYFEWLYVLTSS